jgi:hypothetical protein
MELSVELGVGFYWVRDLVRVSFFFSSDSRAFPRTPSKL